MSPADRIGAFLKGTDCFFRVWAPHAQTLAVLIQDGPYWETGDVINRQDLVKSGEYWSGTVPGVKAWQMYRYEMRDGAGDTFPTNDPAARDVLSSDLTRSDPSGRNGSIIQGDWAVPWKPFDTPRFKDFRIYQCHIGSFAGYNDDFNKKWSTFKDIESKLAYVRDMGFNCIQFLPVHEFAADRSWGYNPASFFAPESSYGSPFNLAHLVDEAHKLGLAVIFDVVYNHAGPGDNILWQFDGYSKDGKDGGIYFEGGQDTWWGQGPAWQKPEVQDFFYQNAKMFIDDYHGDGLRFDVTTQINGNYLKIVMDELRKDYPDKYFIAEHLPDNPWIVKTGRFCASWDANSHHECQRALNGQDPLNKVIGFLGWDGYDNSWNLVKYTLGSHDDIGDQSGGNAENGLSNWDSRHRYFVDQFGGREDWNARAKCRLAWALNVAMPGTPMMFMGTECHMASPFVSWGYWHDGTDDNGDHRFNWNAAGDATGMEMRLLVGTCNAVRKDNPALTADSLAIPHADHTNQVLGFVRQDGENLVLVVVNLSDQNFTDHSYGVLSGQNGQWTQILCTQDAPFGGWDGAGNAFYEPWTQGDGKVYINLPKWSLVILRKK